jgi:broad specificity phosphatase PhoE
MHGDPGLSPRGQTQAQQIAENLSPIVQSSWLFLSSPKQRARQTLEPLSAHAQTSLRVMADLDERLSEESAEVFYARVNAKIRWLGTNSFQKAPGLLLVTHSDWIHEALTAIPCDTDLQNETYHWWGPAQYMHFRLQSDIWHLENFAHF